MTFHSKRYIGLGFFLLLFMVVAPSVVDWCRDTFGLPPGYGAAGDQQFNQPMPAAVRTTVAELSTGAEGSWVQERVEGGVWVYDLHLLNGGKSSVVQLTTNGQVFRPVPQTPEPESISAEAGD